MNKILVTGGAGFIGGNFVYYMLENYPQTKLICLDALTYAGNPENLKAVENDPRYTFIKGDICDKELIAKFILDVHCYSRDWITKFIYQRGKKNEYTCFP